MAHFVANDTNGAVGDLIAEIYGYDRHSHFDCTAIVYEPFPVIFPELC